MTCVAVQKQRKPGSAKDGNGGPGPLLCLMALFYDPGATAELFQTVRRAHGVFCSHCKNNPVIKHGRYRKHLQRYLCKDCGRTFNDKTDTILHYRHIWMGNWMLALWEFLCGPPNGVSINHVAESIECAYRSTYHMIRRMMDKIRSHPEGILSGTCETDEGYIRAGSKGVPLAGNGEERTIPSRCGLPRGPGRSTFEKNTPMMTVYHQRATENEPGLTIFEVPVNDGKTLAGRAAEKFERGSMVITDKHTAYKSLGEAGYDHPTVNHGEGEYASGDLNGIHTNNCECRVGLLKWWLKKHRGVSKWYLESYVKSFQFAHNHHHYGVNGRFLAALAAILDQYPERQA